MLAFLLSIFLAFSFQKVFFKKINADQALDSILSLFCNGRDPIKLVNY